MPSEGDYKSRKDIKGGSPKGKDMRYCPRPLKKRALELGIAIIAKGNESYFLHNPNAKGRFTTKVWTPIVEILKIEMPVYCEEYFGGREEKAGSLMAQRVHKMFYVYENGKRYRGKSREHPDNWED